MTPGDEMLVERARNINLSWWVIEDLLLKAESEECRKILNEELDRAFIREHRSCSDTY